MNMDIEFPEPSAYFLQSTNKQMDSILINRGSTNETAEDLIERSMRLVAIEFDTDFASISSVVIDKSMSELESDSLEAYERLINEQSSYLNQVDEEIRKWTQFEHDYQDLKTRLSSLPDRLTYDCMVPFGKLAFIPGRIIHSNEILVLLGENYFVERSCKQSIEIIERRLKKINENLDKHKKEKDVFDQQKNYAREFLDDKTKFFEIKEEENEKMEVEVSGRRAKLSEEEIREERRRLQETARKFSELTSKRIHHDDDDEEEVEEETSRKVVEKSSKRVHFADEEQSEDEEDDDAQEEEIREILKTIKIRHTTIEKNSVEEPNGDLFVHPGQIGRAPTAPVNNLAFTGKTIERTPNLPSNSEPTSKRISKFRASRQ